MHVSSLPSSFGIGTFGQEAFRFVDFLSRAGIKVWQVLPLCPIDETGSPYQSFSTFAGNGLFIDLPSLKDEGVLESGDFETLNWGDNEARVDFDKVKVNKNQVLRKAFKNWLETRGRQELDDFIESNDWVLNYAIFMVLFNKFNGLAWWSWPVEFKTREAQALHDFKKSNENEILFFVFEQFLFFRQWNRLKSYAVQKDVCIIGDLPIYVAGNSADVWADPQNFSLNSDLTPKKVSGCPPDAFSADGQLWGNPVYCWNEMKKNDYDWWVKRFKAYGEMFDMFRIDHFRGFESFYEIDAREKTARNGEWVEGPGMDLFSKVEQKIGRLNVIAEDLGFITDGVKKLLHDTGFPGMKILQFGFDPRDASGHLPHTFSHNSVCYTGTHDNNTIMGWFKEIDEDSNAYCRRYLHIESEPLNWAFIRAAVSSVCDLAIIPTQDFLGLDETCRMNVPGTAKNNWNWRLKPDEMSQLEGLTSKIFDLVKLYGR